MSEYENVRMLQKWKMSESFETGKCQNLKMSSFQILTKNGFWHFQIPTFSSSEGFWHFPVLKHFDIFRFWHFPVLKHFDIFKFWHFPVLKYFDPFRFWHFSDLEAFWHFQIATSSHSGVFRFWHVQGYIWTVIFANNKNTQTCTWLKQGKEELAAGRIFLKITFF